MLVTILSVFFGLFGILHFLSGKTLENYAVDNGLLNAFVAVRMSGALLISGAILVHIEDYQQFGFYAFTLFLLLSAFILHRFWDQDTRRNQMVEFFHFSKNIIMAILIWYVYENL